MAASFLPRTFAEVQLQYTCYHMTQAGDRSAEEPVLRSASRVARSTSPIDGSPTSWSQVQSPCILTSSNLCYHNSLPYKKYTACCISARRPLFSLNPLEPRGAHDGAVDWRQLAQHGHQPTRSRYRSLATVQTSEIVSRPRPQPPP